MAKLAEGTVGSVFVSNRQAVEVALRYKSAGVIFCHNHPGGRVTPSNADLTLTVSLKKILKWLPFSPMMIWSSTLTPRESSIFLSETVSVRSALDGVTLPPGWL